MAKRFTDTKLNREVWFRKLKPKMKCAFRFLCDECDGAGMWAIDMEAMEFFIGEEILIDDLFSSINSDKENRIERFSNDKIFIPGFISFQYGTLSESSPAHKPVFSLLKKYNLLDRVLGRVSNTLQEKEKDKEEEKEKEEGGVGETKFVVPEMQKVFVKHNPSYPASQEHDFHALRSIYDFLLKFTNDTGQAFTLWDKISLNISSGFYSGKSLKTVASHIQNIYQETLNPVKKPVNGTEKSTSTSKNAGANTILERLKNARMPNA